MSNFCRKIAKNSQNWWFWLQKIIKIWRKFKDQYLFLSAANWPSCSTVGCLVDSSAKIRIAHYMYTSVSNREVQQLIFLHSMEKNSKLDLLKSHCIFYISFHSLCNLTSKTNFSIFQNCECWSISKVLSSSKNRVKRPFCKS